MYPKVKLSPAHFKFEYTECVSIMCLMMSIFPLPKFHLAKYKCHITCKCLGHLGEAAHWWTSSYNKAGGSIIPPQFVKVSRVAVFHCKSSFKGR